MCDSGVTDDPDDPTGEGETYDWFDNPERRGEVTYTPNATPVIRENLPPPDYHTRSGMYGGAIKDAIERNAAAEREAQIDRELEERDNVGAKDPSVYGYSSDVQQWVDKISAEKEATRQANLLPWQTDAFKKAEFDRANPLGIGLLQHTPYKDDPTTEKNEAIEAAGRYGEWKDTHDDEGNEYKPGWRNDIRNFAAKNPLVTKGVKAAAEWGLAAATGGLSLPFTNTAAALMPKGHPLHKSVPEAIVGAFPLNRFIPNNPLLTAGFKGLTTAAVGDGTKNPIENLRTFSQNLMPEISKGNWTDEGRAVGKFFTDGADKLGEWLTGKEEPGRNLTQTIDWTPKSAANTLGLGDLTGRYTGMTRKKKK